MDADILVEKGSQYKDNSRAFNKETSVFASWKQDNKAIYDKCFEHDFDNWKLQKVVKDAVDVSGLHSE